MSHGSMTTLVPPQRTHIAACESIRNSMGAIVHTAIKAGRLRRVERLTEEDVPRSFSSAARESHSPPSETHAFNSCYSTLQCIGH